MYGAKDKCEERVRDERAEKLRKLSAEQSSRYLERQLGKTREVLAEKNDTGTTGNYLKARILLPDNRIPVSGMIYSGKITSINPVEISVERWTQP